jgi:hypothetical protein
MAKTKATASKRIGKRELRAEIKRWPVEDPPGVFRRGGGLPDLLLPDEPSTIGRDRIDEAIAAVIARRKSR